MLHVVQHNHQTFHGRAWVGSVADPGGGVSGVSPPSKNSSQNPPPLEEFLDPPLRVLHGMGPASTPAEEPQPMFVYVLPVGTCIAPMAPMDGNITVPAWTEVNVNGSIRVICNRGHNATTETIMCLPNRTWSAALECKSKFNRCININILISR